MHYIIGTDEAGYGPNLGPLLVSASLWQIPDELPIESMYDALCHAIVRSTSQLANGSDLRVPIADSKQLYKPSGSLLHLERGLFAMLGTLRNSTGMSNRPSDWRSLWPTFGTDFPDLPWYERFDCPVPTAAESKNIGESAELCRRHFELTAMRLLAIRSRAVFPVDFNQMLDRFGNKSTLLSHVTLDLVAELVRTITSDDSAGHTKITVICDKHGGRNKYRELLEEHFPDQFIEIHGESRAISTYRFGQNNFRHEFRFQMRGESLMPPALASLASKYLREMAMKAFNRHWIDQMPELRPTAGYPQDAKRFYAEIEPLLKKKKIEKETIWRRK